MSRSDLLKRMLASYQQGDDDSFRAAAGEVIDDERRKHHRLLADELETIMSTRSRGSSTEPMKLSSLRPLPTARDDAPLVELLSPRRDLSSQILRPETARVLQDIAEERRRGAELRSHGLQPVRMALFVGPPGTGKTTSAEALAGELGVPLARVHVPSVVSSLLGDTAKNLAAIFDACREEPWVLVFDEFDALGRERSDASEHGELKRLVTTFLQLLDEYHGPALVIAATNHPAMLDHAVWRRFDEVVAFRNPTQKETERQVRRLFRRMQLDAQPVEVARTLRGLSQAEVEMVCQSAMKRVVLRGEQVVGEADIAASARRMQERTSTIRSFRA